MTANDGGMQFSSLFDQKKGKYYASTYKDNFSGESYNANGTPVTNTDAASIWENINFTIDNVWEMIKKLLAAFGIKINEETQETITPANTFPSQTADGYHTQEAGMSTAGIIALAAVAGGALLYGGFKPKKGKKSK